VLCSGSLPYKHKIVVAGNHELSFDNKFMQQDRVLYKFDPKLVRSYLHHKGLTEMKDLLSNCTYLEDSETTVFGLRVYGSPWYDNSISGIITSPRILCFCISLFVLIDCLLVCLSLCRITHHQG